MNRQPYNVTDINLAHALITIGIPLFKHDDGSEPFTKVATKHGQSYNFQFEHCNELGDQTDYYVKAWYDDEWKPLDPNDPFLYLKADHQNRNTLLDVVKKSATLMIIEKNGKIAYISSDLPEDLKNKILAKL